MIAMTLKKEWQTYRQDTEERMPVKQTGRTLKELRITVRQVDRQASVRWILSTARPQGQGT